MSLLEISPQVFDLLKETKTICLWTEPGVLDFTTKHPGKVIIAGKNKKIEVPISPTTACNIDGFLSGTLFDGSQLPYLLTYNAKSLLSYLRHFNKKLSLPTTPLVDLYVIESFLNINLGWPQNANEFVQRFNRVCKNKAWQKLYYKIHLPLLTEVLPTIETTPMVDFTDKMPQYPYYEIEGQANGRFNSCKKFALGYLPHSLGPDKRKVLVPQNKQLLLSIDYSHCEVNVLQWLSKDDRLKAIIDSGKDLHAEIYQILTGDPCDTPSKRQKSKGVFLPVMFGCGSRKLAENINVPEPVAKTLIERIRTSFPVATNWMYDQQELAKQTGQSMDYFGRPRTYTDNYYLARDSAVQGVAATICQEHLIQLYRMLQNYENASILFTVHDGFTLSVPPEKAKEIMLKTEEVLSRESELCQGLKMGVKMKYGFKLDNMKAMKSA